MSNNDSRNDVEINQYLQDEITYDLWARYKNGEPDTVTYQFKDFLTEAGCEKIGETLCNELRIESINDVFDHVSEQAYERHKEFHHGDEVKVPVARITFSKYEVEDIQLEDGITNEWGKERPSDSDRDSDDPLDDTAKLERASDSATQIGFACNRLFPDCPMSIEELEDLLLNANAINWILYPSPDEISEFFVVSGTTSCHLELANGQWLSPHNSGQSWEKHLDCETATEVADKEVRDGWSVLELSSSE